MRNARVNEIEIANKIYIKIGESLSSITRPTFSDDTYIDGCMYQFFAYIQYILIRSIVNNFCAIIGNYDTKRDCLKSWESFQLGIENMSLLKAVRARYSDIRNNLIAHLSDSFDLDKANKITTAQIDEDINYIKDILNIVRQLNGIPILIQGYHANDNYSVQGIQKLFERLLDQSSESLNLGLTKPEVVD